MRHSTEVVDLMRLDSGDDVEEVGGISEIAVVQKELDSGIMSVSVDVVNARGVEGGATAHDTMDFVSLLQQELGEIGAVLTRDAGDESTLRFGLDLLFLRRRHVWLRGRGWP